MQLLRVCHQNISGSGGIGDSLMEGAIRKPDGTGAPHAKRVAQNRQKGVSTMRACSSLLSNEDVSRIVGAKLYLLCMCACE